MNTTWTDYRVVKAEIATRYPARRRVRRDSSLEITATHVGAEQPRGAGPRSPPVSAAAVGRQCR